MKKSSFVRAAVTSVLLLVATNLQADTFGLNFSNTTAAGVGGPPFTIGFSFRANTDITVTGLALFDGSPDGLIEAHQIGLWNSTGTLLTSTTVQAGVGSALVDKFRVENVAPTQLDGAADYFIGALFTTDQEPIIFPGSADGFVTGPEVSFLAARRTSGAALSFPESDFGPAPGFFGPNFTYTTVVVPEPSTVILLGSVLIAASALTRRRLNMS